ncbi:hypothetical protein BDA96_01G274200 [Sorghum bicolor]|uniref:Uncharacterized protein n=1 Tax=Sorghum bicolor TaxID=4558 RepID=A0A921S118_SORBI|nr:hypothetical protein BDA96_01G274200 [Sorghum bicolor]
MGCQKKLELYANQQYLGWAARSSGPQLQTLAADGGQREAPARGGVGAGPHHVAPRLGGGCAPHRSHIATVRARASRPAACVVRAPSTDRCCIAIPGGAGGAGTATARTSSSAQEVGMEGPIPLPRITPATSLGDFIQPALEKAGQRDAA